MGWPLWLFHTQDLGFWWAMDGPGYPHFLTSWQVQPWLAAHQHISTDGIGNQSSAEQAVAHQVIAGMGGWGGLGSISSGAEGF